MQERGLLNFLKGTSLFLTCIRTLRLNSLVAGTVLKAVMKGVEEEVMAVKDVTGLIAASAVDLVQSLAGQVMEGHGFIHQQKETIRLPFSRRRAVAKNTNG